MILCAFPSGFNSLTCRLNLNHQSIFTSIIHIHCIAWCGWALLLCVGVLKPSGSKNLQPLNRGVAEDINTPGLCNHCHHRYKDGRMCAGVNPGSKNLRWFANNIDKIQIEKKSVTLLMPDSNNLQTLNPGGNEEWRYISEDVLWPFLYFLSPPSSSSSSSSSSSFSAREWYKVPFRSC